MNWLTTVIKGTAVNIAYDEDSIFIYNAFAIKEDLKMRGYRWNADDKSWHTTPADVEAELRVLQNNLENTVPIPTETLPSAGSRITGSSTSAMLSRFPASCSVVELRNRIDQLLRDGLKGRIWVRGIVASEIKNYRWFSYLDLRDEDEHCDIFFNVEIGKNDLDTINRRLKESGTAGALEKDLPIFAHVEVHLSLRNAVDIRLRLLDILPEYTQAKIRNQREITLDRLQTEGLLDKQKKLRLPMLVTRLGLITSGQGTSIRDILAGLTPFAEKYSFYFVDTRMEGPSAVDSVTAALDYLEHIAGLQLDALIIARGGGSEQSLSVFNDYRLCRRICACSIPVLTAVGHEKDISAAEICSFLTPTPSTPSGLGKYLQELFTGLQMSLSASVQQLVHHFNTLHSREIEKIRAFLENIPLKAASLLRSEENFLSIQVRRLEQSLSFIVRDRQRRIEDQVKFILSQTTALRSREQRQLEKRIAAIDFRRQSRLNDLLQEDIRRLCRDLLLRGKRLMLDKERNLLSRVDLVKAGDLERLLKKGFTLVLDEDNRVIKRLRDFWKNRGDTRLRFSDGTVKIRKEEEIQINE